MLMFIGKEVRLDGERTTKAKTAQFIVKARQTSDGATAITFHDYAIIPDPGAYINILNGACTKIPTTQDDVAAEDAFKARLAGVALFVDEAGGISEVLRKDLEIFSNF
jgi:hypothetical protein